MKTYNAEKRISPELRRAIENTIDTNERYKNCYFWSNTGSASQRRSNEKKFSCENPSYRIITKKGIIEVVHSLDISCANFYYSLNITFNDNKSNLTRLKNLIKR